MLDFLFIACVGTSEFCVSAILKFQKQDSGMLNIAITSFLSRNHFTFLVYSIIDCCYSNCYSYCTYLDSTRMDSDCLYVYKKRSK